MEGTGFKIKRILVIDNDDDDILFLKHELAGSRYLFTAVTSVAAALELLGEDDGSLPEAKSEGDGDTFDIILCDYWLPGIDGLGCLKLIKESDIASPFVMMSGLDNERLAVAARELGAADFFVKDDVFKNPTKFVERLDAILLKHQPQTEVEPGLAQPLHSTDTVRH